MGRLEGKVAIITGGAVGIGEGDARLFAKEGAKVVIADIKEAEGRKVAEDIKKEGAESIFIKHDVAKEGDWQFLMAEVIKRYGKLNILVNNAGVSLGKTIEETSLDEWNWVMDINSTGVFLGTKYAIKTMKNNGEPCSIVNRGSLDSYFGESGLAAYCASKGAVKSLTDAAALACAENRYKIRVNAVHPGLVHTKLTEKEARELGITFEQYEKKFAAATPLGRIGQPSDLAYADLYLASDESSWVTGSDFDIDGGLLASGGLCNRPQEPTK